MELTLSMKKSFQQFITEASYDKDVIGRSQITKSGEGGRKYADRKKTEPEIRRTKAVGGGKLNLLSHTNLVKILVRIDLNLIENNNQRRKEGVLHYQQRKHKERHIRKERQENQVLRLKLHLSC